MQSKAWYTSLLLMFREFMVEAATKTGYEIVNLYVCPKTGFTKAVIRLSNRHTIEKNISDIVIDNDFIENLDKKTIRTLTYIATVERLKPDFSVLVQKMATEVDDYILELRTRTGEKVIKSLSEISQDQSIVSKLSPVEANRIGYLAGVRETVKEYALCNQK